MDPFGHSRARRASIACAAVAISLLLATPVFAAPSAVDEYRLDTPGIQRSQVSVSASGSRIRNLGTEQQIGVSGEASPAPSVLQATFSTVADSPVAAIAAACALLALSARPFAARLRRTG
jgi:hypothetical protein